MCGICGFILPKNNHVSNGWKKRIISEMMLNSSSRGQDACGIAFIDNEGELKVYKAPGAPSRFVFSDLFNEATKNLPNIVMAHTRAASKNSGDPANNVNNHPVYSEESGIALIHNGLIAQDAAWRKTVGKEKGILKDFVGEVDTEVLLRVLETFWLTKEGAGENHQSFEDNIADMCYNIAGSYTCAILQKDNANKIYFVRNSSPLSLAYSPHENIILFASSNEIIAKSLAVEETYLNFFITTNTPEGWIINTTMDDQIIVIESLDDSFVITGEKAPIGEARKKVFSH